MVALGSKWQPTHALVRDPDAGIFYERNPRMDTSTDLLVQRALLEQRRNNAPAYWLLTTLLIGACVALVKVLL